MLQSNISDMPVLLVTGASKGIGLNVVIEALVGGYAVAATSRDPQKLRDSVTAALEEAKAAHYPEIDPEALSDSQHFLPLELSFSPQEVKSSAASAIHEVRSHFGRLDVLLNNAGYAVLGAFEEISLEQIRSNFDVNVFGVMATMQAALPFLREQAAQGTTPHIINIASVSATLTSPTQAIYSATKAAVLLATQAIAQEVAPLGIVATAVCPAGVRTDFLDKRSMQTGTSSVAGYDGVVQTMDSLAKFNHNQPGDPRLVAQALLTLAKMPDAPTTIYLGEPALRGMTRYAQEVQDNLARYEVLSLSIDAPAN